MKKAKIIIEDAHRKSQGKVAIEWAIQDLDRAETMEELKEIWWRYPALHSTWQLIKKGKQVKNRILNASHGHN